MDFQALRNPLPHQTDLVEEGDAHVSPASTATGENLSSFQTRLTRTSLPSHTAEQTVAANSDADVPSSRRRCQLG